MPKLPARSGRPVRGPSSRLLACVALAAAAGLAACTPGAESLSQAERRAIADTLFAKLEAAYDFSRDAGVPADSVVARLMSLYPDSGRVVSAGAGRLTASRDTLEAQVRHFWTFIGVNMQEPRTRWGARYADVLSRTSAVVTTTYAIEHRTPQGAPHLLGGAWTALFQKRGDRWVIVQEHLSDTPMGAMTP